MELLKPRPGTAASRDFDIVQIKTAPEDAVDEKIESETQIQRYVLNLGETKLGLSCCHD
ncbi:hypothetical protein [Burkholderia ubonensis]|uniref:hypothetical protein n=1 Tax=Burkholderia ubonensis TaxID=101571 RepID=UPI000A742C74|nr:hypothetical protein [Burkholderia ubonensis]